MIFIIYEMFGYLILCYIRILIEKQDNKEFFGLFGKYLN